MISNSLNPDPSALRVIQYCSDANAIIFELKSIKSNASCPDCSIPSDKIHSRYIRIIADLPCHGIAVKLKLHTRRFFCHNCFCRRRIFCERLPAVVDKHARKTNRLNYALSIIGFALGGEAGSRAAIRLGMSTSPDTLIRRIRQSIQPGSGTTTRVLGVDDWAKRKGQSYGTILVDLEKHEVVDLLQDRDSSTLQAWLSKRPGVEIITRDRAGAYAEGARRGAPQAVQVADRWHLLKNLTEAVERALQTQHIYLQKAYIQMEKEISIGTEPIPTITNEITSTRLDQWNERRQHRYEEVKSLHRQGVTIRQIAKQLRMHR
jgi:transposase